MLKRILSTLLTGAAMLAMSGPAKAAPPAVMCHGMAATIVGTNLADTIRGTAADDVIAALDGNDVVYGLGGNDLVCLGDGHDVFFDSEGPGHDRVDGETGDDMYVADVQDDSDLFDGGPGLADVINYGVRTKSLSVTIGDNVANDGEVVSAESDGILPTVEQIIGGSDRDRLIGNAAINKIVGGAGADLIQGSDNADTLVGEAGDDTLEGGFGADILIGESGNDRLFGQGDDDTLDSVDGLANNDSLNGGPGLMDTCNSDPDIEVACEL